MKKILISLMALGTLSTATYADCSGGACSSVKIDSILILSNGSITVGTSGTETGLTCAAAGGKYLAIDANAVGKNAMYSALLTAQTTKATLSIRTNDDASACQIAYVFSKS